MGETWSDARYESWAYEAAGWRHLDGCNVLLFDGHVEWSKWAGYDAVTPPIGSLRHEGGKFNWGYAFEVN